MLDKNVEEFNKLINQFRENYESFVSKGNRTAGTRARKDLLDLGKLTKTIRSEIQEVKNK